MFIIAYGIGPGEYHNKSNRKAGTTGISTGHECIEVELECMSISLKINSSVETEIQGISIFDELIIQEMISLTNYINHSHPDESEPCFLLLDYRFKPNKFFLINSWRLVLHSMNTVQCIQVLMADHCQRAEVGFSKIPEFSQFTCKILLCERLTADSMHNLSLSTALSLACPLLSSPLTAYISNTSPKLTVLC